MIIHAGQRTTRHSILIGGKFFTTKGSIFDGLFVFSELKNIQKFRNKNEFFPNLLD
jgi:hypothetical protein